jgi:hypothetical protein
LVTIDERDEGTYLIFKDRETRLPRYELLAIPHKVGPESLVYEKSNQVLAFIVDLDLSGKEVSTISACRSGEINATSGSNDIMTFKESSLNENQDLAMERTTATSKVKRIYEDL